MILQVIVKGGKACDPMYDKYLSVLKDGLYAVQIREIKTPKTKAEYLKYYFFICEYLAEQSETGYTKKEFHQLFKDKLLLENKNNSHFVENVMDFIDHSGNYMSLKKTTKILSVLGWEQFIVDVKNYVKENLNLYL